MALNLNWINPGEYSFQTFLLLERFQIRLMMEWGGWHSDKDEWRRCMGIALRANPAIRWYLEHRCPECAPLVSALRLAPRRPVRRRSGTRRRMR